MREAYERLPRGPKGDRGERGIQGEHGDRGQRGERGLSPATRRAVVFLVGLTLFASGVNLFWTAYLVRQANRAKCSTVLSLASIPVPAAQITAGARRFDIQLEAAFTKRAAALGCGKGTP